MKEVACAVIIRNNLVLLARRKAGEKLAGYWEFPGGKIEPGETVQQCLARELLEELGVVAAIGPFFARSVYHYDHLSIELIAHEAAVESDEFALTVHDKVALVPAEKLLEYRLSPADIPIAEKIISRK